MRILHINTEKGWRGGERQVLFLMSGLQQKGVKNLLVCKKDSAIAAAAKAASLQTKQLALNGLFDLGSYWRLLRLVKSMPFDLIHAHTPKAQTFVVIASLFGKVPAVICTKRTVFRIKNSFFTRYKYKTAIIRHYIAISSAVARQIQSVTSTPVTVIPSAIDLQQYLPASNSTANITIGYAGALSHEKGPDLFIKAAAIISKKIPDARFIMYGEGREYEPLMALRQSLQLENKLELAGFQTNILEKLAKLNVLLYPSREEGLGSTILDAFALKIPVVATYVGGIPDLISHHKNGLLAASDDAEGLAAHTISLLENSQLHECIVAQAYNTVQGYDIATMVEKTHALYEQIINKT